MADEYFDLASLEHFWVQWRFEILKDSWDLMPEGQCRALDIGCGNGVLLEQLRSYSSYQLAGCDLHYEALEKVRAAGTQLYLYNINERRQEFMGQFDAVFLMDVVEHIEDDRAFIAAAASHLRPGGVMVLNVPYGPLLYGRYDRLNGHFRRYDRRSLAALLDSADLRLLRLVCWGFSLVPIVMLRNTVSLFQREDEVVRTGFGVPGPLFNRFMAKLGRVERRLCTRPPIGSSLLAFAQLAGRAHA